MEVGKVPSQQRKSGVELLRLILMLMVITLHYNGENGNAMAFSQTFSFSRFYTYIGEALSICAVNCFMIISGYFLAYNKKIQFKRILSILLTVIFVYEGAYIFKVICKQDDFSIMAFAGAAIPANYFAFLYLTTYILSPFVNMIFEKLETIKKCAPFIIMVLVLFTIYPTLNEIFYLLLKFLKNDYYDLRGSISTISGIGNLSGYSIVNFMLMYCIGAFTRRFNVSIKKSICLAGYLVSSVLIFLVSIKFPALSRDYFFIPCVSSAWFLFMIFNQLDFNSKTINYISKSTFGVFCLHASLSFLFFPQEKISEYISSGNAISTIINSLMCIGAMFVCSYAAITLFLFITSPIRYAFYKARFTNLTWTFGDEEI